MTPEERKDWERRLAIMRGQQLASSGPLADPILGRTEGSILQSHGLSPNLGLINPDRDRVVLDYLESKRPLPTRPPWGQRRGEDALTFQDYGSRLTGATTPDPSAIPTTRALTDRPIDPLALSTSQIPTIPSATGGLSAADVAELQALQGKWGGRMDAHAFATGTTSRRRSFDSGLGKLGIGSTIKDDFQTIEHGEWKFTYHKNPQTGKWTVIGASPKWERKSWATYEDTNGRERFKEGPYFGRLVSEVAGQPMVEKEEKPEFTELADGRKYWVTGPKAGQLVLDKDLKKPLDPTPDIKEHEYGEGILSEMAKVGKEKGYQSPEYLALKDQYERFRVGTRGDVGTSIENFEKLKELEREADNIKSIYGENSQQYKNAKTNADFFRKETFGTTQTTYKPEPRMFINNETGDRIPGFISYERRDGNMVPIYKNMDNEVITNVTPIPPAQMTTTMNEWLQSNPTVRKFMGEGVTSQFESVISVEQFSGLLKDLNRLGAGTTGLRGWAIESIGGYVGQFSPVLEEGLARGLGGISSQDAAAFRNDLRLAVIDLIPEYTGEESNRITDSERRIAQEASRLLDVGASEVQIRQALMNVLELKLVDEMRGWMVNGYEPKRNLANYDRDLDIWTIDNTMVDELGEWLWSRGYREKEAKRAINRLVSMQIQLKQTLLYKKLTKQRQRK